MADEMGSSTGTVNDAERIGVLKEIGNIQYLKKYPVSSTQYLVRKGVLGERCWPTTTEVPLPLCHDS